MIPKMHPTADETKGIHRLADELLAWIDKKDTAPGVILSALGVVMTAVIATTAATSKEAVEMSRHFTARLNETVLKTVEDKAYSSTNTVQ